MEYDTLTVLEFCAACAFAFWFVGFCMLWVAGRKAGREFRAKGYMRRPSGTAWVFFLMRRRYEAFENPSARFFFGISHFCLVGMMISVAAVVILLGCELLLYGAMQVP
jgi:hypothetical protein